MIWRVVLIIIGTALMFLGMNYTFAAHVVEKKQDVIISYLLSVGSILVSTILLVIASSI